MVSISQDQQGYIIDYQYPDPSVMNITVAGQSEKPAHRATTTWYVDFGDITEEAGLAERFDIEARAPRELFNSGRVPFRYLSLRLNRYRPEWVAKNLVRVELEYGLPHYRVGEDNWTRDFSVSSRSIHISRSQYGGHYGNPPVGARFGDLIGVNEDGVAGVNIEEAVGNYVMTTSYSPDHLASSATVCIRHEIAFYIDCINDVAFEGFAPGSLRLGNGTSVKRDADGTTRVTLNFQYSRTEEVVVPIYVAGNNGQVTEVRKHFLKGGWDYLWTFTRETLTNVGAGGVRMKVQQPWGAQINYVYDTRNFQELINFLS